MILFQRLLMLISNGLIFSLSRLDPLLSHIQNSTDIQSQNYFYLSHLNPSWISRLNKTWAALSRKDRQQYERMVELFSDKNNWEQLRSHVNSLKLPMIPYLGMAALLCFSSGFLSHTFYHSIQIFYLVIRKNVDLFFIHNEIDMVGCFFWFKKERSQYFFKLKIDYM